MQEGWYFDYGMITTQTCDLADEGNGKPRFAWAQVCPVYNAKDPHPTDPAKHVLDGGTRKLILEGRDQHRMAVPVPGDGLWVADFRWRSRSKGAGSPLNRTDRGVFERRRSLGGWSGAGVAASSPGIRQPICQERPEAARECPAVLATADRLHYQLMHGKIAEVGVVSASHTEMTDVAITVLYDSLSAAAKRMVARAVGNLEGAGRGRGRQSAAP